jgi:hypothetical protein
MEKEGGIDLRPCVAGMGVTEGEEEKAEDDDVISLRPLFAGT